MRYPLRAVDEAASMVLSALAGHGRATVLGSCGRRQETCGDLDVLFIGPCPSLLLSMLMPHARVSDDCVRGSVYDIPTEVWFCDEETERWMKMYLEGPLKRNTEMRALAARQGLRLTRRGLEDVTV